MTLQRASIKVGSKIWFAREQHEVVGLGALAVLLKSLRNGQQLTVATAELLTSTGFSTLDAPTTDASSPEATQHALPGYVTKEQEAAAKALLSHLLEAMTGFRSGSAEDALEHEPRDEYDPDAKSKSERFVAKAKELKLGGRVLWKYHHEYRAFGLLGLVDRRATRVPLRKNSDIITHAIDRVVRSRTSKSNLTAKRIVALVQAEIKATESLPTDFQIPNEHWLHREIFRREDAKRLLRSAPSRRNAANRPQKAYTRFFATRAGEIILIDSTPLDVIALHPVTHQPVRLELTIAIDLYTRSIVGWRFTGNTKSVDAALLLADIISPKRSREFLGEATGKPFVGIPESIVTRLCTEEPEEEFGALVDIPFLHPESVLIDQGRVFLSETFRHAASTLGINVMLARPYTPTDKAQVERMFRTIRDRFVQGLPGYTGPNVQARGAHVEDDAFYYIHEIDDLFREWVADHWQTRTHDGLFLPQVPTLELTPNEMLAESIARAGFMCVLPDQDMYYELLPVVWRKINHYGVQVDSLLYDSGALDPFRNTPSPYPNVSNGQWPFRQDPRDKSLLIFWDPETKSWAKIPWVGAKNKHRPFDGKSLAYAKQIAFNRIGAPPTAQDVEQALNEFLDKVGNISNASRKERVLLSKAMAEGDKARQDRERRSGSGDRKDSAVSDWDAQTAIRDPGVNGAGPVFTAPALIRPVADDAGDDPEGSDVTDSEEDSSELTTSGYSIKPVGEAHEDDDDDLDY